MTTHAASAPSAHISDNTLATAVAITLTGTSLASGDTVVTFPNDGNTLVIFTAGATTTCKALGQNGVANSTTCTLTSGDSYILGPFDQAKYDDGSGLCHLSLGTASGSHTVQFVYGPATTPSFGTKHNPFETSTTAADY